jgi:tetratricopeptide (TPR) repeat protein
VSRSRPPLTDSYEGLHQRARNLWILDDPAGAVALYRRLVDKLYRLGDRILDRRPELRDLHRMARHELATLLHQQGRYAEAMEVVQVLLETHPEETTLWRRDLASLRVAKGDVEAGLAELRDLTREKPDDFRIWYALGLEARIEGRFAESEEAFDAALEVCPENGEEDLARIHYQRFRLFQDAGRIDDALAAWEAAREADPDLAETVREVYEMLTEVGRYREALSYIDRDENTLQAGFQRGLIASRTGNPARAREQWRRVSELDPDEFQYGHDAWVEAVLRLKDADRALQWLQDGLARYQTPRLAVLSGIAWAMHGDPDLAARLFQEAINAVRHQRPPKQKLDSAEWRLLDMLVADQETKKGLKTYFAVIETLWT